MGIWVSWDTSGRSSTISCGRLSGQTWGSNFYIQTTTTGRRLFNLRPQSELSASWERIPPFFQRSYSQLPIEKFNLTALWFEPGREECSQKSSNSSIRAWTSRLCMARKNILLQSLSFRSHLLGPLVVKTWGIFTTYSPSTSISPSLRFTVRWWLHLRSRWERITNLSSFSGVFFVRSTCPFLGRNANSLIQSPGLVGNSIFTADWSQCTLTNRRNSWTLFPRYWNTIGCHWRWFKKQWDWQCGSLNFFHWCVYGSTTSTWTCTRSQPLNSALTLATGMTWLLA